MLHSLLLVRSLLLLAPGGIINAVMTGAVIGAATPTAVATTTAAASARTVGGSEASAGMVACGALDLCFSFSTGLDNILVTSFSAASRSSSCKHACTYLSKRNRLRFSWGEIRGGGQSKRQGWAKTNRAKTNRQTM
jgi:hypothetical protein